MENTLFQALALIVPLIFAIVFHEVAHGYTARLLGDPTASQRKRLSLNPLRHVDPMGTIILPAILKLSGGPVFGWAKPVPVNPMRLNNPRRDMMLVAAAGPGANLVLALVGALLLGLLVRAAGAPGFGLGVAFVAANLSNFIAINVFLALFNLLPIPPFDGSHIVEGLLPDDAVRAYAKLRPYGFVLLFTLLLIVPWLFPEFGIVEKLVLPPFDWAIAHYEGIVRMFAGA
jgi:Zn-dependent protease